MIAVVTSSVPKTVLFKVFSGLANHISNAQLNPFIGNMHVALWVLAAVSLLGTGVCLLRPRHSTTGARIAEPLDATRVPPAVPAPASVPASR